MVIFISWSGDISKEIAEVLKVELSSLFAGAKDLSIFVSSQDIASGTEWFQEISNAINESVCGILCLTKENTTSENVADWIEFEAGALAYHLKDSPKTVIPFLFDVTIPSRSPLKQFEFVKFNINHYTKLIVDLNAKLLGEILDKNQIKDLAKVSFNERFAPEVKRRLGEFAESDKIEIFPSGELRIISGSVYLSCPMASIKSEDEYNEIRLLALNTIKTLKDYCGVSQIYAPIEHIESKSKFDGQEKAASDNFEKLKTSEFLLCFFPKPIPTSVLVEIGYGIALYKKIIIFTQKKNKSKLPYILQDGEKSFKNIKIYEYNENEEIIEKMRKNGKTFLR